ncbi:MAG: hypothetical protein JWO79_4869 [Actinomycetia bacterium]|nr:hypothetical protein [Actinomycetes bacterium]
MTWSESTSPAAPPVPESAWGAGPAARRACVAAARAQAARCRAGLRAGEDRYPAGEWAAREREALDALRVLAGFLELHAADPIAQAITTHLTPPASVAAKPGA